MPDENLSSLLVESSGDNHKFTPEEEDRRLIGDQRRLATKAKTLMDNIPNGRALAWNSMTVLADLLKTKTDGTTFVEDVREIIETHNELLRQGQPPDSAIQALYDACNFEMRDQGRLGPAALKTSVAERFIAELQ